MTIDFPEPTPHDLTGADAARLHRWQAHGQPVIPLVTDPDGTVQVSTTSPHTILRSQTPQMAAFRAAAATWLDQHCPG